MDLRMTLISSQDAVQAFESEGAKNREERREANRQLAVLLPAKISGNGYETLCRVHNISVNGAKIETLVTLKQEDQVRIEFRSDMVANGIVRWVKQGVAGIEFTASVDITKILKRSDFHISRNKPRPPRYSCNTHAEVEKDGVKFECKVADISITGAKLRGAKQLRTGDLLFVHVTGLSRHRAKVVWQRGDEAGVRMVNPYRYDEIEWWLFVNGMAEASAC